MKQIIALSLVLLLCLSTRNTYGQNKKNITGFVTDSTKVGIQSAKIRLISGTDTLVTTTDADGKFKFSKLISLRFSIQISSLGYLDYKAEYTLSEKEKSRVLDPIILQASSEMLKEVVITAKPNPVRFMQDTVEYNALAFQVNEGDNVADLMKQLPGMEVDKNYNVKTMGTDMVKLRVNGKDFFTSNIKDFIGKLPSGIVSKIQVIDDFGDEANFSGIKIGTPIKMLNIVTKPGMDNGNFGNVNANAGTNDMIGSNAEVNLWKKDNQRSASANINTSTMGQVPAGL
ncbi:MAG: carboxypeptidase-like regulatory domain-containing protein [Bacteroidota bacterium]